MAVDFHRVLNGDFDKFLFTVGGYCDRTFAIRRHFPAIDKFSAHVMSPSGFEKLQTRVLNHRRIRGLRPRGQTFQARLA
jgi:hypothetical protein